MRSLTITLALLLVATPAVHGQSAIQLSHIGANVPDAVNFDGILKRDLLAYFKASGLPTVDLVEFKLLRDAPTQSGVSYPKYYAWVKVLSSGSILQQGAVRVAAVDKVRFDVTTFISKGQALQERSSVEKVFPAALIPRIMQLAGGA